MITIAFFFLLRPGEYTGTWQDQPFCLADVEFTTGNVCVKGPMLLTHPAEHLLHSAGVSLTFTNQKNGVQGEVIHHGPSGSLLACPVRAVARQVIHLRAQTADLSTALGSYFHHHRCHPVRAADIMDTLCTATRQIGNQLGLSPNNVSVRSMRTGGAMALLNSNVDSTLIKLLGRWRSDEMMRYLHLQAQPVMNQFAQRMLVGGEYTVHPGITVPLT
mgnify:CR=1 FL=1